MQSTLSELLDRIVRRHPVATVAALCAFAVLVAAQVGSAGYALGADLANQQNARQATQGG